MQTLASELDKSIQQSISTEDTQIVKLTQLKKNVKDLLAIFYDTSVVSNNMER